MVSEDQGDTSTGPLSSIMYIDMKIINISKTIYANKSATYNSEFGYFILNGHNSFSFERENEKSYVWNKCQTASC